MSNSSQPSKKPESKPGNLKAVQTRAQQLTEKRLRDMATRSTLSRLRNRKSALK